MGSEKEGEERGRPYRGREGGRKDKTGKSERKGEAGGEERGRKGRGTILKVERRLRNINILQLVLLNYINVLQAQR